MNKKKTDKVDVVIITAIGMALIAMIIICVVIKIRGNDVKKIVSAEATATTEETLTELTVLTPTPYICETEETVAVETVSTIDDYIPETTETSYTPVESEPEITESTVVHSEESESILTRSKGVNYNKNGNRETWYNLNMSGVVKIMRDKGFSEEEYPYWVREDGCKMLGDYIIVAANHDIYPRGTTVHTSLGEGLVCDTGSFIYTYPTGIDIAVNW